MDITSLDEEEGLAILESLKAIEDATSRYWQIPTLCVDAKKFVELGDDSPGKELHLIDGSRLEPEGRDIGIDDHPRAGQLWVNPETGGICTEDGEETGERYVQRVPYRAIKNSAEVRDAIQDASIELRKLIAELTPTKTFRFSGSITVTYNVTGTVEHKPTDYDDVAGEITAFLDRLDASSAVQNGYIDGMDESTEILDSYIEEEEAEIYDIDVREED